MIGMFNRTFTFLLAIVFPVLLHGQDARRKRIPMDPSGSLTFGTATTPSPRPGALPQAPLSQPPAGVTPPAPQTMVPTPDQPFASGPRPSLTPLEIQAAIYAIAGLPEVATVGTFTVPPGGTVNVADALLFLQTGNSVEINLQILPTGKHPLTVALTHPSGFGTLPIPPEYAGEIATFKTNRPVCFYVPKPMDGIMFGADISRVLRQLVAPKTSDRRVQMLSRPNLRLDLLPHDPQAVSEHPDTKDYWDTFLKRIATLR